MCDWEGGSGAVADDRPTNPHHHLSRVHHPSAGDYKTAHSYFLEAFEAYDSLSDPRATKCLQYMMLCSILQVGAAGRVSTYLEV